MQRTLWKACVPRIKKTLQLLIWITPFTILLHLPSAAELTPGAGDTKTAPSFARIDLNGRTVDLSAYRGKVVLLNFWATWCGPCLTEIPNFVIWQQMYGGRGFQVIGISMDDDVQPVRKIYLKYHPTRYKLYPSPLHQSVPAKVRQ